ncbi:1-(5-phosphoribosyl)-5-[(5-phosphoribosylamino)methylideneamino]imidazole-4-carboxamide isomerase [Propionispora hippei]|uniref:1-(5-phosphoribosyl)-5-[(5-phosphoribosylamino)methylideneamino] imidazole-4-carboxamide isomerase n=1 Tax=Propionispora hippei DSM 15287 TaxID=1123003 RepID=A0A1M6C8S1_9FIRM|nr:1-(5-phosphoribosyl)-5-[(5-phosphoribosylamino)methylideneamino]imidazole-4-carboxamide isomerase [Propionispora hippei]SHI57138.1 1-(5-phosphoribosyl)-5-[(5-phosphoribosylamino)methylideneamino] imidazole-4-carboxamide isomerase [Propionispora hippei DSM 15287]
MLIFPAIDIRGGKCVRLTEGRFDRETVFADQPVDMALRWVREGAEYLHVVDLDGALEGKAVNLDLVAAIVKAVDIPVQLGGGIRTLDYMETLFDKGVARVILGSIAVRQPDLVKEACRLYSDRVVVGIDARDGQVAVEGWGVTGGIQAEELAKRMAAVGVARIIYTDISRDGTLSGVNVPSTCSLAKAAGIPVIASGGVSGLADIAAVKEAEAAGVEGVIVGKAIYTGKLSLAEALKVARGE